MLMMLGMAASPVHKLHIWMELSVECMRMLVLIKYVLHNSK